MRAASHIAMMEPIAAQISDPAIENGEMVARPIRTGMMIGDDQGSHDRMTAALLLGFTRTAFRKIHPLMMSRMIGKTACWASCSLLTIEPAAANSVA